MARTSSSMPKIWWDQFYHFLRMLCTDGDEEDLRIARDLFNHLTTPRGIYDSLLNYMEYYSTQFLLPTIGYYIKEFPWRTTFTRVVDLGAGKGWLGRGLSEDLGLRYPPLLVDRRPWEGATVLDLEKQEGIQALMKMLVPPQDLIVCSELIHCLDVPSLLLDAIRDYPLVILEYDIAYLDLGASYDRQVSEYGARPIDLVGLAGLLAPREVTNRHLPPYVLLLSDACYIHQEKERRA